MREGIKEIKEIVREQGLEIRVELEKMRKQLEGRKMDKGRNTINQKKE